MIDSLCHQAREEDISVVSLYCDYHVQPDQTTTNIMGSILKQLVSWGDISKDVREAFQQAETVVGRRSPQLKDLTRMVVTAIASLPQVFICIDALDEYLPKDLPELLESLKDIVREAPSTRIFLTGRPHVGEEIQRYFPKAVTIPIIPNQDDIRSYLEMMLGRDHEPEAMDNDLRADIVKIIQDKMSDTYVRVFPLETMHTYKMGLSRFLLVSLNIEAILSEVTIGQRRTKLKEMALSNGLGDAYTEALTRLKAQKGYKAVLGLKVLMWVLYSERPLRAEELCHALGVEMGATDLDPENIPALQTLLASCLGLVTLEASSSTVRLVHFTLQEYLLRDPTLFHSPHSTIAEFCLTYLNFGSVRDLSPNLPSAPSTMPFLEYASCYWGEHARRGTTEKVKILALKLLNRFDEHISARLLLFHYNQHAFWERPWQVRGPRGFTGLHAAAALGIVEVVAAVLEMKEWNANATDYMGGTALTWAARGGQEEVVKMLLDREDANPDQATTVDGQTLLSWAAGNGHQVLVKMLLEREDVNPNRLDPYYGRTPLSRAAEKGHEKVVKIFLEREDVDPKQADTFYGRTPLSLAAECGHEEVVEMFLERGDVNPDQADAKHGRTPLSWAAKEGHEKVVQILLGREDVDPNKADTKHGRTPLSLAAMYGHAGIVKMLLEREDVNPDHTEIEYSRTPLWWGVENQYEGVVGMLLKREDVNPNRAITADGQTPLAWAVTNKLQDVVKILLKREDVDPSQAITIDGWTPLVWAAANGYEEIVKILLQREEVNPDHADSEHGWAPLIWAARGGHVGIVRMLLEDEDVNPKQAITPNGQMPLSWAAENGHEGVAKVLLERKNVDPGLVDTKYGCTPLWLAAMNGHGGIVKILLEQEDVNPNEVDTERGQTLLWLAAKNGHQEVVKILLEREDVNPNQEITPVGWTPLAWAAANGYEDIIKILLQREDVNPDDADPGYGRTPLTWAIIAGHERVVGMLLERGGVNPDYVHPECGVTPLLLAAVSGHEGIVKMLLEREGVDPNRADTVYGQTPLSRAAAWGHEGVVMMLLEREGVNPDQPDTRDYRTPLAWAARNGHAGVVKILLQRNDVRPARLDNENQTPLSLAFSEGHGGVVRILRERGDVDSGQHNPGGQASTLSSAGRWGRSVGGMRHGSHDPLTNNTDFNSQPGHPPANSDWWGVVLGLKGSVPVSSDSDLPAAKVSRFPQPSTIWPLKFLYPPRKSDTHPNDASSALIAVINRSWVIAACVCLLAFLAYHKNSHD